MANTFNRADTLLGICEALGEDMGFNPLGLRIALAVGLIWNPAAMVAAYLGLGLVVVAARLVTPVRTPQMTAAETAPVADNDDETVALRQAA